AGLRRGTLGSSTTPSNFDSVGSDIETPNIVEEDPEVAEPLASAFVLLPLVPPHTLVPALQEVVQPGGVREAMNGVWTDDPCRIAAHRLLVLEGKYFAKANRHPTSRAVRPFVVILDGQRRTV